MTTTIEQAMQIAQAEQNGQEAPTFDEAPQVEEAEIVEEQAEEVVEAEEEAQEEVSAEPAKPKSKYIPRGRFDEVNTQKKALEDSVAALQAKLDKAERERDEAHSLVRGKLTPEGKENLEEDKELTEDDFLDPAAYKAFKKMEAKLAAQEEKGVVKDFNSYLAADIRDCSAVDSHYTQRRDIVIAQDAADIQAEAALIGEKISDDEATQLAANKFIQLAREAHAKGKSMGSIVQHRYQTIAGRLPENLRLPLWNETKTEKTVAKQGASVNMGKLKELNQSAGAPTNKSAAADMLNGSDWNSIMQQASKEMDADKSKVSF